MNRRWTSTIALSLLLLVAAGGCSALAQEDKATLVRDIKALDVEIVSAQAESAKYASGLVKVLIDSRVATMQQTRAMLDQRDKASAFGIGVRYTVNGQTFAAPADAAAQLSAVEREISAANDKIQAQRGEVAKYSGGLVLAMALSTLATMEQSVAMLDQRRMALKYALPQYVGFQTQSQQTPAPATPTPGAPLASGPLRISPAPAPSASAYEIVSIESKVTESNSVWWRYAWKLTLKNKADRAMAVSGEIEFQDKDGFVIDSARTGQLGVSAGATEAFTGFALVRVPGAQNVARTVAKMSAATR